MEIEKDANRSGSYRLQALEMGTYRWGSLLPEFMPFARASALDFHRNLASVITKTGTWRSPVEFRGWACLTHELTHYLQDLTTGVGHWDHFVRRRTKSDLLSQALRLCGPDVEFPIEAMAASDAPLDPPLQSALTKARALNDELRDQLLVVYGGAVPAARHAALAEQAAPLPNGGGNLNAFRIEALLEGEAAAVVVRQVLSTKRAGDRQWEILNENSTAWNLDQMPSEYSDLWFTVTALTHHLLGEDPDAISDEMHAYLFELNGKLLGLLVDIACAHPSPELLEELGADRRDYEPGLRLLRLLVAIDEMTEPQLAEFLPAVMSHDLERAEALMLDRCPYRYAPVRAINEDWLPRFDSGPDARWTERLRAECCQGRLEQPGAWIEKSLFSIVEQKLPFMVIGPDGITSIGQQWQHLDSSNKAVIFGDLTAHAMELAASDFFFEEGRFVCPRGTSKTCPSATESCRVGLRRSSEFPPAPGCEARGWLQDLGFWMGGDE